jgi:hypothetical protein
MKRNLIPVLLAAACFTSCEMKVDTGKAPAAETEKQAASNANIRNNITLNASGLKVTEAYLRDEAGGLLSNENKTDIGKPVTLVLKIEGWKEQAGKVKLGAGETIITNDGKNVLDEPDLFATTDFVSATDAGVITLKAVITNMDKPYPYFTVSFRVWDKLGAGNISGSYKLYMN